MAGEASGRGDSGGSCCCEYGDLTSKPEMRCLTACAIVDATCRKGTPVKPFDEAAWLTRGACREELRLCGGQCEEKVAYVIAEVHVAVGGLQGRERLSRLGCKHRDHTL